MLSAGIPVRSNDEYAIWMLRARALADFGRLDPRVFTDTGAGYQHLNYPLFLPSLVAWLEQWVGRPSEAAAHAAVAVTVGALLAVVGAVLTRLAGPAAAAVALLLVVSLPTVLSQSLLLLADLSVFAFTFGLVLVLLRWLALPAGDPAGRAWLAAAAALGAGAIGTKSEGLAFAGIGLRRGAAARRRPPPGGGGGRRRRAGRERPVAGVRAGARPARLGGQRREPEPGPRPRGAALGRPSGRVMAERWPGGSGAGLAVLVAAGPAAVLAVRAGAGGWCSSSASWSPSTSRSSSPST